jgi:hypothetical protein
MPIQLQVDRSAGWARTTVTGTFTVTDVRRYLGRAVDQRVFDVPELVDARRAEPMQWRPRDLLAIAGLIHDAFGGHRVPPRAIVVDTDSHFGQARIFASFLAGRMRVAVFDDLDEAERWLVDVTSDEDAGAAVPSSHESR